MKGIEEGYELPREAEDDVWSLTERERKSLGIDPLPKNLHEAIAVAENSELLAETLGEHVFDFFLRNKRAEWEEYRSAGVRLRARPDAAGAVSRAPDRFARVSSMPLLVVEHEADVPVPAGWGSGWRGRRRRSTYAGRTPVTRCPATWPGTPGCVVLGGAMGALRRRGPPLADRRQAAGPAAVDDGTPVLGICLGPPARRGRARRRGRRRQPARPADRRARRRLDRRRRTTTGCSARSWRATDARAVQWNNDVVTRLPDGRRRRWRTPRTASCRPPGSRRRSGACSGTPRPARRSSGPWADHDRDDAVERGVDVDAYVADVAAARDRLRATWRVLADALRARVCREPAGADAAGR